MEGNGTVPCNRGSAWKERISWPGDKENYNTGPGPPKFENEDCSKKQQWKGFVQNYGTGIVEKREKGLGKVSTSEKKGRNLETFKCVDRCVL